MVQMLQKNVFSLLSHLIFHFIILTLVCIHTIHVSLVTLYGSVGGSYRLTSGLVV